MGAIAILINKNESQIHNTIWKKIGKRQNHYNLLFLKMFFERMKWNDILCKGNYINKKTMRKNMRVINDIQDINYL